jgi:hypothetical protein
MSRNTTPPVARPRLGPALLRVAAAALLCLLATDCPLLAQGFGFGGQAVGGISIDTSGIVAAVDGRVLESLADARRRALASGTAPAGRTDLRKVSLAAVVAAVNDSVASGRPLTPDVLLLGGLERVTHVFVDPDGHDIVLAGPADVPAVDPAGNLVAAASGRPLLQLEDLIVALRSIDGARAGGVRCSIDPTPEGLARLQRFLGAQRQMGADPQAIFRGMEEAVGPQVVSVGGVPTDSRLAHVLVAADFRMKRIGMGFEPSGVRELPSYLSMVPAGGKAATLPRFWLEADYDPIARDPDELAWHLPGRRMRCLTESDALAPGQVQRGGGAADRVAQRWCESMTTHYDALSRKHSVFAELVNCVDLAVVAALIRGRQLDARAGLDLGALLDAERVVLPTYEPAEKVPTVANGLKKGNVWLLSASGGVQFQPWQFAANVADSADMATLRRDALAARPDIGGRRWWD